MTRIERFLPKDGKIIDLGSGYGIFSNYIAAREKQRKVFAIELDADKTSIAKEAARKGRIKNITFFSSDITELTITDADVIIIMHVLHHLKSFEEQERLLNNCIKKLKQGGLLILDEVDKNYSPQYFLALLTDTLLYRGDRFFYRSKKNMLQFLERFPLKIEVRDVNNFLMPYPELVYVCRKK